MCCVHLQAPPPPIASEDTNSGVSTEVSDGESNNNEGNRSAPTGVHSPLGTFLSISYIQPKVGLANVVLATAVAFSASHMNGQYFP